MGNKVLIIGYGNVGKNLGEELRCLKPDVYDKYLHIDTRCSEQYDFAYVCVDTPNTKQSLCDLTEVCNAIRENNASLYVLKSTVLPGSTEWICQSTGKRVVFSPEYYGASQHCNNFDFDFTILGGEKEDCIAVVQMLQHVYDARHRFMITDNKTAELAKYMENCWLAMKVSFCSQFYDIAEEIGVQYEELRELFLCDPRVHPSHTYVYRDRPYWDSHCLNKDTAAIAGMANAPLLKSMIQFNEEQKQRSDVVNGNHL